MKSPTFSSASSTSSSAESLSIGSSSSFSSSQAYDVMHAQQQQHSSQSNASARSHASASAPGSAGPPATAGTASGDVESESYERNFWATVFDESTMDDTLLGDEAMDVDNDRHHGDENEMKHSPNAHAASHFDSSALDATPSSALLDHWSHYDDDSMESSMAEFAVPPTMAPSSSLAPSSASYFSHALMFQPQHPLTGSLNHDAYRAFSKPSVDYSSPCESKFTPAAVTALRSFAFEKRSDGTPFALSKPILRDDGILLVGTEHIDDDDNASSASAHDKNRIFVTDANATHPGQNAANILVDSEVRDLHWMNHETAIAAIGHDIHLIRIGAVSGNRSCHLQPPIPRVHSDAVRELAVHTANSLVLSGGFDETVVLTDLRRSGDPTESAIVSKFDAHDVVSSVRWSPDESQMSWTTDGGDFQIGDARAKSPQLKVPFYKYLRVEAMGGLFTHEYLNAHKIVLGFEKNHLVYIDTRMPRDSCCYAVTKSPMGATGEIRRSKTANKFAVFGLGGFTSAELSLNTKSQEVLKLRQYIQSSSTLYKTSGDYSFESNSVLAVSDNTGTVTFYSSDASPRVQDASVLDTWKEERTV